VADGRGSIRLPCDFVVESAGKCSFCHTSQHPTASVSGLPQGICSECLWISAEIVAGRWEHSPATTASELHCSFCDRSQRDVPKLIAGPRIGHLRTHLA
jgi:hypothetical protein